MRALYVLIFCLFTFGGAMAQEELSKEEQERRERNIKAGNPFAKFGYEAKVATLSKGKYLEVHDLDSIVTIGTVRYHVEKKKIVGFVAPDTTGGMYARPVLDTPSRWISVDPLAEEFPSWNPYTFVYNNPVRYIDPDGRAPVSARETDYGINEKGDVVQIGPTDNKPDRLFVLKPDGTKDENVAPIVVTDKKLLPQLKSEENTAEAKSLGVDISGPVANTTNTSDAYKVFKFAAENSNVEWSLQDYTDGTSAVATAKDNSTTVTGSHHISNKGKTVSRDIHSHPNSTPKDLRPSGVDINRKDYFLRKNNQAKVWLYMPKAPNPNARMLDLVNNKWILKY